MLFKHGEMIL